MKTIALLLLGAHAFGLAKAMPCTHGAQEVPACEHATPPFGSAIIDEGGRACDACHMPDCRDMATCASTATAMTSVNLVSWIPSALRAGVLASIRPLRSFERTPIRPPPRA